MSQTLIPTCSFRWLRDYDGERILQQRFVRPSGGEVWQDVPEVAFDEARVSAPVSREGE
jgi:hypothetical protein